MKIQEYLELHNIKLYEIADRAQVSCSWLYDYLKYKKWISQYQAEKISKATDGAVSIDEIMDPDKRQYVIPAHTRRWKFRNGTSRD